MRGGGLEKTINADLSRELWKPLGKGADKPRDLIYFIANPRELDVAFTEFCKLFGYAATYQLRGFTSVADEKIGAFYDRYDDLYSLLLKLKAGQTIAQKVYPSGSTKPVPPSPNVPADEVGPEGQVSVIRNGKRY